MNLDRTSDPYCIIRFVDEDCQPVSSSNQSGFRTKHVLKTLNPVWNQQLVFHGDSGFTLATYIHIEVWDRDVVTADTCMGEVFVPLCRVSSNSLRLSLRLNWSPLMPSQYRKSKSPIDPHLYDIQIRNILAHWSWMSEVLDPKTSSILILDTHDIFIEMHSLEFLR